MSSGFNLTEVVPPEMDNVSDLTFHRLRDANVKRCEQVFHPLDSWNPLEWAGAMGGEAGEAANFAKKLRRLADFIEGTSKEPHTMLTPDELEDAIAIEAADTVIYADLLCARVRRSLGQAIIEKFNFVSRELGASFFL